MKNWDSTTKVKSSNHLLIIVLIAGLVIGGVLGYSLPSLFPEPSAKSQDITLIDSTVKELSATQLRILVTNNDPDNGNIYTVTIRTDPSVTVYIGNTLLMYKNGLYNHTFYLDSEDSVIKRYNIRVGTLPEPTTSVSFNIDIKIYGNDENKPIAQRELEITIKK